MSEKEDLIYRYMDAFNAEGFEGGARFWDPEVTWHTDPLVPEPGVYSGRETVRAYLEGFSRTLGTFRVEVKQVIDLGGDDVLVVTTVAGHPLAATEREAQLFDWAFIISVREGRILRIHSFFDKGRAFEAAGLSE
jgi:ketosteroid isomerase-like protein